MAHLCDTLRVAWLVVLVGCGPRGSSVTTLAAPASATAARVDAYLDTVRANHDFSGVAMVAAGGVVVASKVYGIAHRR